MIIVLVVLEEGFIDSEDIFYCPGYFEVSNCKFYCWKCGGYGNVNFEIVLCESCDVYFYEIVLKVGIEKILVMVWCFGLGVWYNILMLVVV